jgi:hypothetical protein
MRRKSVENAYSWRTKCIEKAYKKRRNNDLKKHRKSVEKKA